ncbi:MAG: hypothetical protein ACTSPY_17675, partial [Candidatus Helarchaeota archaeon]
FKAGRIYQIKCDSREIVTKIMGHLLVALQLKRSTSKKRVILRNDGKIMLWDIGKYYNNRELRKNARKARRSVNKVSNNVLLVKTGDLKKSVGILEVLRSFIEEFRVKAFVISDLARLIEAVRHRDEGTGKRGLQDTTPRISRWEAAGKLINVGARANLSRIFMSLKF